MSVYNPTSTYHTSITIPDDGQPRTAASVNSPFQDLADSVKYVRDRLHAPDAVADGFAFGAILRSPVQADADSWAFGGSFVTGPGTAGFAFFRVPDAVLVQGGVLTSLSIVMAVGVSHSGVPASLPNFDMKRAQSLTALGAPNVLVSLSGSGPASPATPGSGAAWYSSGNLQTWTQTLNQNNTIDRSQYPEYAIQVHDEGSTNSHPGNIFYGFILKYSSVI